MIGGRGGRAAGRRCHPDAAGVLCSPVRSRPPAGSIRCLPAHGSAVDSVFPHTCVLLGALDLSTAEPEPADGDANPRTEVCPDRRGFVYPGCCMVRIWLPADAHRRLLAALPEWAPAHRVLKDAPETQYAVGVRRVTCPLQDALALLQVAERVYPESAQLIRIAIRKTGVTHTTQRAVEPLPDLLPDPPSTDAGLRLSPHHSLVGAHVLVLGFQLLQLLDRLRDVFRRLL